MISATCFICKSDLLCHTANYISIEGVLQENRHYFTYCDECRKFLLRLIDLSKMNAALNHEKSKNCKGGYGVNECENEGEKCQ